jgi:putative ABC transport system substrate-binding protein
MLPPVPIGSNRALINRLAVEHALAALYTDREFAAEGGHMSYGSDARDTYRQSASYIDRVLKGEKPADLAVPRLSSSWWSISRPPKRSG